MKRQCKERVILRDRLSRRSRANGESMLIGCSMRGRAIILSCSFGPRLADEWRAYSLAAVEVISETRRHPICQGA